MKIFGHFLIFFLIVFSLPTFAFDIGGIFNAKIQELDKNYKNLSKEDLLLLQNKASDGDVESQVVLGLFYFTGTYVEKESQKALYWFTKASEQKDVQAQLLAGILYLNNKELTKAKEILVKIYKKEPVASTLLGMMHYLFLPHKDYDQAKKYFLYAANQDEPESQYYLGQMYINGEGVQKNHENSFKWLLRSSKLDNKKAQFLVAHMFNNGWGVQKNITKANMWIKRSCKSGVLEACETVFE